MDSKGNHGGLMTDRAFISKGRDASMKFPVQQGKKSFKRAILDQLVEQQKQIGELRSTIRDLIEKEVEKSMGDKYHMIQSTLNDVIVQRKIFMDKGFITREEINAKYEELKAGK